MIDNQSPVNDVTFERAYCQIETLKQTVLAIHKQWDVRPEPPMTRAQYAKQGELDDRERAVKEQEQAIATRLYNVEQVELRAKEADRAAADLKRETRRQEETYARKEAHWTAVVDMRNEKQAEQERGRRRDQHELEAHLDRVQAQWVLLAE